MIETMKEMHKKGKFGFLKGKHCSPSTEFKKGQVSYSKLHPEIMPRGKGHPRWKGGRVITIKGYAWKHCPDHPCANHGYVWEHRLVLERHLGRYLGTEENCHHLGKKDDNRLEMLMLFSSNSAHTNKNNACICLAVMVICFHKKGA